MKGPNTYDPLYEITIPKLNSAFERSVANAKRYVQYLFASIAKIFLFFIIGSFIIILLQGFENSYINIIGNFLVFGFFVIDKIIDTKKRIFSKVNQNQIDSILHGDYFSISKINQPLIETLVENCEEANGTVEYLISVLPFHQFSLILTMFIIFII